MVWVTAGVLMLPYPVNGTVGEPPIGSWHSSPESRPGQAMYSGPWLQGSEATSQAVVQPARQHRDDSSWRRMALVDLYVI